MDEQSLEAQVGVFDGLKADLLQRYGPHEWVVVAEGKFQDHFAVFADAARFVAREFSSKPALVRQVEGEPLFVPFIMARG